MTTSDIQKKLITNGLTWQVVVLNVSLAIIAATPPTLMALSARDEARDAKNQTSQTHDLVNSRMTDMLAIVKAAALARGILEEKTREQAARGEAAERLPDRTEKDYSK